jgi:hypothetical protein
MKVAHWVLGNRSGMNKVSRILQAAEVALGVESFIVHSDDVKTQDAADSADIHVVHTHCSDKALRSGKPIIWVCHGTPEVMFHSTHEQATVVAAYGHADAFMLQQFWLQHADTVVTFWPRHEQIIRSMSDKGRDIRCLELGVNLAYWKDGASQGRFNGSPSVFTAENCYEIKWPLDLFTAWPWVVGSDPTLYGARLHAIYVPNDQHRYWFPLVNRNGCSFVSHITSIVFSEDQMRNAFQSTDYYIGLVRYGDHNLTCLEARAAGATLISYEGNPYSHYWVSEGDQRRIAGQLSAILKGETPKRDPKPVVDISDTAKEMIKIYEGMVK